MPLTDADKSKIGGFLSAVVRGTADLGFGALPLVKLYKQAQAEKLPFAEMLARDPEAAAQLIEAFHRQARKLPPSVVAGLEQVIQAAKSGPSR